MKRRERLLVQHAGRGEPIAAALVPCSADGRRPSLLGQDWVPDEPEEEEETSQDEELPNGDQNDPAARGTGTVP